MQAKPHNSAVLHGLVHPSSSQRDSPHPHTQLVPFTVTAGPACMHGGNSMQNTHTAGQHREYSSSRAHHTTVSNNHNNSCRGKTKQAGTTTDNLDIGTPATHTPQPAIYCVCTPPVGGMQPQPQQQLYNCSRTPECSPMTRACLCAEASAGRAVDSPGASDTSNQEEHRAAAVARHNSC
jgi:hypothetical protein